MFTLHPQLEKDTISLGKMPLCEVLLAKDANYPWLILVPRRADVSELYQLNKDDAHQFMKESSFVAAKMHVHFQADKINVAALGNQVPQLHVHHVARYKTDAAWPAPIWGKVASKDYDADELEVLANSLKALFGEVLE